LIASSSAGSEGYTLVRSDLEMEETESLLPEQFAGKKMVVYDRDRHGSVKLFLAGGDFVAGGGDGNGIRNLELESNFEGSSVFQMLPRSVKEGRSSLIDCTLKEDLAS
jgi:hypothetical protein